MFLKLDYFEAGIDVMCYEMPDRDPWVSFRPFKEFMLEFSYEYHRRRRRRRRRCCCFCNSVMF
jgi:hypothetical protein